MIDGTTLFLLIMLFVGTISFWTFTTIRSGSPFRVAAPTMILLALTIGYCGAAYVSGTAKPVSAFPGWAAPDLSGDGATVLGGSLSEDTAYLMIQEPGRTAPRLYALPMSEDMKKGLRSAMKSQADRQKGNPWGFKMTKGGPRGDEAADRDRSQKSGEKHQASNGEADGSHVDDAPYQFGDPPPKTYTDKSVEVGTPIYEEFK